MRQNIHKYTHYRGIVSNTVPGRCYSIQELLSRVQRGQPLPMVPPQYEESKELSEGEIDAQIDAFERHPMYDKDFDIIDAKNGIEMINEHERQFEAQKKKKKTSSKTK